MKVTKLTIATIASAALVFGAVSPAMAYPVGTDTQLVLSQTSAIRAGKVIKVKAKNVDRDCEVTFTIQGRGNDNEDYDIASAFSGANYSTAYTGISVPDNAGVYNLQAEYEDGCRVTGEHANKTAVAFQVGKVTQLGTPTFTSTQALLAKKPTLNFSGSLTFKSSIGGTATGFAGQTVLVSVTVRATTGATVTLPAIKTITNSLGVYVGKQALTTKNLKGTYTVKATYVPTNASLYKGATSPDMESGISISSVKAKIAAATAAKLAAAKAAKLAAVKRIVNINLLTR